MIERVRAKQPAEYLKLCAHLFPKELRIDQAIEFTAVVQQVSERLKTIQGERIEDTALPNKLPERIEQDRGAEKIKSNP